MIENDSRMQRIEEACKGLYQDEAEWAWRALAEGSSEQACINCILRDRQG